jgi:hypothetical protein
LIVFYILLNGSLINQISLIKNKNK